MADNIDFISKLLGSGLNAIPVTSEGEIVSGAKPASNPVVPLTAEELVNGPVTPTAPAVAAEPAAPVPTITTPAPAKPQSDTRTFIRQRKEVKKGGSKSQSEAVQSAKSEEAEKNLIRAVEDEKKAIQKSVDAENKLFAKEYNAKQKQNETFQKIDKKREEYINKARNVLDTKINNLNKNIENLSKMEYKDFWANKSTGDKIISAISLFLGGIGAGLTGGDNVAIKALENAQKQDFEAFKEKRQARVSAIENSRLSIAEKRQAIDAELRMWDAQEIAATNKIKREVDLVASKIKSQDSQAKADQLKAQLDQELNKKILDTQQKYAKEVTEVAQTEIESVKIDPETNEVIEGLRTDDNKDMTLDQTKQLNVYKLGNEILPRLEELETPDVLAEVAEFDKYSEAGRDISKTSFFGPIIESAGLISNIPKAMRAGLSKEAQEYIALREEFLQLKLRVDSGAAIRVDEKGEERDVFFAMPGSNAAEIQTKREARRRAIKSARRASGREKSEIAFFEREDFVDKKFGEGYESPRFKKWKEKRNK